MLRRSLIEQLDQALEAMLARPEEPFEQTDPRLAPLLQLAAELRDLPRSEFKAALKSQLGGNQPMTTRAEAHLEEKKQSRVSPVPPGYHTITPYLVSQDAPALIDFIRQTFAAELKFQSIGSAGGIHAEVRVGDSMLMIGGGGPGLSWRGQALPTSLHVYVEDADAVYGRPASWRDLD